jgi:hypothetical protein
VDWSNFWSDFFSWRPFASRLEHAISSENLEKVRAVLDGAPHRGIPKETLVGVIMERRDEVLRLFLERGVVLDQPLEWGGTAFHVAARYGSVAAVRLMLSRGIDINVDGDGTPLYWAADQGRLDMVELLISLGADPRKVAVERIGTSSFKPKEASPEEFSNIREVVRKAIQRAN